MREAGRYKLAGYAGWLAVAVPTFADISSGRLAGGRAMLWMAAFAVFGIVYAVYLRPRTDTERRTRSVLLLIVLTASALTMVVTSAGLMKYLASVTLTIVAGELPYVLPAAAVWSWIAAHGIILAVLFWRSSGWVAGVAGGAAYTGFQVLAVGRTWLEVRERAARHQLALANAELRATRALLAENTRTAERMRIARDLHDSLGHHLTALSLQLDLATRLSDGQAAAHLQHAHALTRLLLADVRSVVSDFRSNDGVDVSAALALF